MFEYFVNEVELGNLICLFGNIPNNAYWFGDETREVILNLLDNEFDGF